MKYLMIFLLASFLTLSTVSSAAQDTKPPRIGIAGIRIESSTFSPARTVERDFLVREGETLLNSYPFLREGSALRESAVWLPVMTANTTPGGAVTRETYESLVGRTMALLRQNAPYDALFLDIHGAMSVVGLDDPEGDLILRIREVIGKEAVISTCMDLHGNVSRTLAENTDLMTCYRMAPHEDAMESKERAVSNLIGRLRSGKGRPGFKAWIPVPILLPGEQTSTRVEPARSLYAKVEPIARRDGVLDAGVWIGYAWADEPRNHAVVMVTGDDREAVGSAAEELASYFWDVRHEFRFVAPTGTLEECLRAALTSASKPYFISDTGDNPTAGGAGDVTWTLARLLEREEFTSDQGPGLIYASLPGAEFVRRAFEAGVGNRVEGFAGAEVDDRYSPPIKLTGIVTSLSDHPSNREAVVKIGSIYVIVTEKRKGFHRENEFTKHSLDARQADIVVVKIGYLEPELYEMQRGWMMALTPGGVNQDLQGLPYRRIQRPMFPLDRDMPRPDLTARFIPFAADKQ